MLVISNSWRDAREIRWTRSDCNACIRYRLIWALIASIFRLSTPCTLLLRKRWCVAHAAVAHGALRWRKRKQKGISLHDIGGAVGGGGNAERRGRRAKERFPLPCQLAVAIRFYCLSNKTCRPGWGRGEVGELTNCITGHYRCSVIDYLYPYKMPGSPVDQASSDKMFPLNHHTRANNTFKYIRELSDKVLRV